MNIIQSSAPDEIFAHKTREVRFYLCVDDSRIKYTSTDDADHILNALGGKYAITTDWEGKNFCGLTFHWNYEVDYVDMEMTGYVTNALNRPQHTTPVSPQYSNITMKISKPWDIMCYYYRLGDSHKTQGTIHRFTDKEE